MSLTVRIVLTLAVLALLPAYSALASGEVTALTFTINPAGGPQGTPVTVSGQGAQVGLPVQVMLVTDGETGAGALALVQAMPDTNGNFTATLIVPAEAAAGRYAVRAEQRDAQGALVQYYWISFNVGPALVPVTGGWRGNSLTLAGALAALLVGLIAFQGIRLALRRA
ncbi:MAG: hypothetical protein ACP5R2_01490 [Anaerolineae bacterium]